MLLAFRLGDRAAFLTGFAKGTRENIDAEELAAARVIADYWLAAKCSGDNNRFDQGAFDRSEQ